MPDAEQADRAVSRASLWRQITDFLPRHQVLSPWVVLLPGVWHLVPFFVIANPTRGLEAAAHLGATLILGAALAGLARFPIAVASWLVMVLAPVLYTALALAHSLVAGGLMSLVAGQATVSTVSGLVSLVTWVGLGYVGWSLAGAGEKLRRSPRVIAELQQSLGSMTAYQRNRIRVQLRVLLRDLASRLDRVVHDMTMESAGSDQAQARTIPHRDELADQLVDTIESRLYQAVAAERSQVPAPWWVTITPGRAVIVTALFAATLALASPTSFTTDGAMVFVALTIVFATHLGLHLVSTQLRPHLWRSILVVVAATGSTVLSVSLLEVAQAPSGPAVFWLATATALALIVVASVHTRRTLRLEGSRQHTLELVRECVNLAIRYDTLTHTNARTLYSATLGTLIFASVDLTDARSKPSTRDAALDTMASRIVTEIQIRVGQLEPLPEDHIRLVAAVWQSAARVSVSFRQEVFSRFLWGDETIRGLQQRVGSLVLEAIESHDGEVVVSVVVKDRSVLAEVSCGEPSSGFGQPGRLSEQTTIHQVEATPITQVRRPEPEQVLKAV